MDVELQKRIKEVTEQLRTLAIDNIEFELMDPIARMMLVALLYESEKIEDYLKSIGDRLLDHFCEDFIPRKEVSAMPAIALVAPCFKKNKDTEIVPVTSGVSFVHKLSGTKTVLNYIPLLKTNLLPFDNLYILTHNKLICAEKTFEATMENPNIMWIGINTKTEIESLENISIFIHGISGISPKKVSIATQTITELQFCSMNRLEDIEMLEPFDAQQSSSNLMSIIRYWKEYLQEIPQGTLLYITDNLKERSLFKRKAYPRKFENWLESEALAYLNDNTIWLEMEYPEGFIIPDSCQITINTLPIVNININSITLNQASPIAKLQEQENTFFIQVMETSNASHKQGFNMSADEIVVRDFDISCYHNGDLYRDVRNLYNRFVEDYYAFIEYNGLKDGEDIRKLKELINKIGKSVGAQNSKYKFDSGTYVMKNINKFPPTTSTKVSYITTQGKAGNALFQSDAGYKEQKLECKKLPIIESNVPVVVGAWGGKDKASADSRYEQIRYYSLTNDRLYTKMDIEAFVRKELIDFYGKEEFKRIAIHIHVEGFAGDTSLCRGLYIDIEFKDQKNYNKAQAECLDKLLHQKIIHRSCISMPITLELINLEE